MGKPPLQNEITGSTNANALSGTNHSGKISAATGARHLRADISEMAMAGAQIGVGITLRDRPRRSVVHPGFVYAGRRSELALD
jgi:hypothetical protein